MWISYAKDFNEENAGQEIFLKFAFEDLQF